MSRSALLVSCQSADQRFSLHPLAQALAPLFTQVDHMVVDSGPPSRDAPPNRPGNDKPDAFAGVRRTAVAVAHPPPERSGQMSRWLSGAALERWAAFPAPALDEAARRADLVLVQSGYATATLPRLRRQAPSARLTLVATESLGRAQSSLAPLFKRRRGLLDTAVALRPALHHELAPLVDAVSLFTPPPDLDPFAPVTPSPFSEQPGIVVVGRSELDAVTIDLAAAACPRATFAVLGTVDRALPGNVRILGDLSMTEAAPFLQHADAALVVSADIDETEAGIRLAEYVALLELLGMPIVCPDSLAGVDPRRYAFDPGRSASLREALLLALTVWPKRLSQPVPRWRDLAELLGGAPTGAVRIREAGRPRGNVHAG